MKNVKLIFAFAIAGAMCSCSTKDVSTNDAVSEEIENVSSEERLAEQDYSDLIETVYAKFVFAIDADPDVYAHPEHYFTAHALKKLSDSYEFDCEDNECYAFYELRTQEQDSKPGTTGESAIIDIESIGNNWYAVSYSDMGWSGMTRIKIDDGKIDDFERCVEDL